MSVGGSGRAPGGFHHRAPQSDAPPTYPSEPAAEGDQSNRGPGAWRNSNGLLSRPATTNQHWPVASESRIR